MGPFFNFFNRSIRTFNMFFHLYNRSPYHIVMLSSVYGYQKEEYTGSLKPTNQTSEHWSSFGSEALSNLQNLVPYHRCSASVLQVESDELCCQQC